MRNLGVFFDSGFTFSSHVSSICKSCFVHLRDLKRIRRYLPQKVAIKLAYGLVSSRLDYCNSLFRCLSCKYSKYSHITPVLDSLHWLPIKYILINILNVNYNFLQTRLPKYFNPHLSLYMCSVNTRRSNPAKLFLNKPHYNACIINPKFNLIIVLLMMVPIYGMTFHMTSTLLLQCPLLDVPVQQGIPTLA